MTTQDYLKHDWIKQKYDGILEVYPSKCANTMVLDKILSELTKTHNIVKIFNDYFRAFEKQGVN